MNNNSYLVVKKHPLESINITKLILKIYFFIEDEDLKNEDIDFYEILGASDLLITDYSSVYFDYLLLNKPIIFGQGILTYTGKIEVSYLIILKR